MQPPRIIAHRGNSYACHENTMAAFARAVADGADGIEFDLHLTRDRHWVIHHDAAINASGRLRTIAKLSLDEVSSRRIGANDDSIPTLTGFLDWSKGHDLSLVFDIKDRDGVDELVHAVEGFALSGRSVFSSFHKSVLTDLKTLRPQWKTALIVGDLHSGLVRRLLGGPMLRWADAHDLSALHLHERWVSPFLVARAQATGLNLGIWTVDDPLRMNVLAALGVDSLITNRPDLARQVLDHF